MRGRNAVDPELARVVEQRLERLLAERGPRRAALDGASTRPNHAGPDVGAADPDAADPDAADPDAADRAPGEGAHRPPDRGRRVAGALDPQHDRRTPYRGIRRLAGDAGADRQPTFGRVHLAVIGVLVVLGLLLAGWAVLRAWPVPLPISAVPESSSDRSPTPSAPPAPGDPSGHPSSEASAGASPAPRARASPPAATLVVHVLGAVRRPGLVELVEAARVQDAIDAAGGPSRGARLGDLNLAQPLADGQQIVVGRSGTKSEVRGAGATGQGGSSADSTDGPGAAPLALDLNAATPEQLETLPGVGPVTAAKIVAWREQHGRFSRLEELQEVAGIGPKTYAEIAPHCRV